MSRYACFDRSLLKIEPLAQREHLLSLDCLVPLDAPMPLPDNEALAAVAQAVVRAREQQRSIILSMGAHVLRAGTVRHLIDLMERGLLTHVACNGAAVVHDFEFALIGKTTESVPKYISSGQFGLWDGVARINDIISRGAKQGLGLGEAIGREILEGDFPHKDISLFANAYRLGIPATVHVGIGYDIVYEHSNCDGAAWGQASYRDFLIFTQSVTGLEHGVFMNFGSAVMGPEVYLKALAMARNVAHQRGEQIRDFTTLVCDLIPIQGDPSKEAPKTDPQYYYRPYKTILVRTVADGGVSYYVQGDHRETIPTLHHRILDSLRGTE